MKLCFLFLCLALTAHASARSNFLLLVTDDRHWDTVGVNDSNNGVQLLIEKWPETSHSSKIDPTYHPAHRKVHPLVEKSF
jgi:hypothetical protein